MDLAEDNDKVNSFIQPERQVRKWTGEENIYTCMYCRSLLDVKKNLHFEDHTLSETFTKSVFY